ncbi:DeoR/GlpR transcriptional regulator [Paenibacillus antri]|uniref:DeoR/GlpR transcriptional regulator n=1 Tax=Paenibacillus antri TaxID=2582848 RepID=A0A5R9G273_9BACL|nr:DeoR/GlpR family DNA-binding transcription regulator [Paenibacillus antri]TLS50457.1 DeoR/GlpR transcriptional regulator [Paenibacillus antri]
MLAVQRHEHIIRTLARERTVRVAELAAALGVTEKTVREDLEKLEEKGLLRRIHGGAVAATDEGEPMLPPPVPNTKYPAEKASIASRAAAAIQPEEIVALDGGSTTLEIAKLLPNAPITVVTNDLFIIAELSRKEQIRLVVPGGYRERNLLVGPEAVEFVRGLNIHKAFLSATGIHPEYGLTVFTGTQLPMKRALVESAGVVHCVADRSKFGRSALVTFASLGEIDTIYTDAGLPKSVADEYRAAGVAVDCGYEEEGEDHP